MNFSLVSYFLSAKNNQYCKNSISKNWFRPKQIRNAYHWIFSKIIFLTIIAVHWSLFRSFGAKNIYMLHWSFFADKNFLFFLYFSLNLTKWRKIYEFEEIGRTIWSTSLRSLLKSQSYSWKYTLRNIFFSFDIRLKVIFFFKICTYFCSNCKRKNLNPF